MPDIGNVDLDGFSVGGSIGPGLDNRERDMVQVGNALEKTGGFTPYANAPADKDVPKDSLFAGSIMGFQAQAGHDPDGAVLKDGPTGTSLGAAMTVRKTHHRDGALTRDNLPRGGLLASSLSPTPKPAAIRNPVGAGQGNAPSDVRAVRSNLSRIGYGQRAIDVKQPNRFDRNLAGGMKRFQANKGLKVDGVANPGGPTDRALQWQVGRQQAAVKQAYETEAASLTDLLGAIGPALAGWRIGQRVAQDQNERRASVGLPPAPPMAPKEDGTIMNARRRIADGDATAGAATAGPGVAKTEAAPNQPVSPRAGIQLAQAKRQEDDTPDTGKDDPKKATERPSGSGAKASADRYTVRHAPNTRWTAKGTIWTPVADDQSASAPKIPAKREIYVGKFLHDKATEKLGLKEAKDVDMAAVSATVLGMATAGKSKKEAMAWLVKTVVAKAPPDRRKPLTTLFAKAVLNAWGGKDRNDREGGWYLITAGFTPEMARKRLQGAYDKLNAVNKYMRGQLGRALTADALEHWLNGSGRPWKLDSKYVRSQSSVRTAINDVKTYYKEWFLGDRSARKPAQKIQTRLARMKVGDSFTIKPYWDGTSKPDAVELINRWAVKGDYHRLVDFLGATGTSKVTGRSPKMTFRKVSGDEGNGTVMVTGRVNFKLWENFNFDKGKTTTIPSLSKGPDRNGAAEKQGPQWPVQFRVNQDRMLELKKYSNARDFEISSDWHLTLYAVLKIKNGKVVGARIRWIPAKK